MHTQPQALPTDTLCTKQGVAELLHMSERSIERLVDAKRFPSPVRLGRQAFWLRETVQKWIDQQFEHQKNWEPRKR
jgi:predicted DNA-binding transcriptional regulator AlpA